MKHYEYSILLFDYDNTTNTLTADETDLLGREGIFPNGRKQFFIGNRKTNGFRRFRIVGESYDKYFFKSEDGIDCTIVKYVNLFPAQ